MWQTRKPPSLVIASSVTAITACLLVYAGIRRGGIAKASLTPELLSLLPSGAPTLIYLDLASVRASGFYQHRPDRGPIAIPNKDYANFVQATGFDFQEDLDRVAIASWPAASAKQEPQNIAVAEGRFNRAKIRDYAIHNGKLDHQDGQEVFLFPDSDTKDWNSVYFLDDHRIAVLTGPSIAPLLGHNNNTAPDPARERAARLDGAAAFFISRVPHIPENSVPGDARSTQLAELARSVQWVTLAARPEGENLRLSLEGECDSGEDARQLQSTLETLRMIGGAALAKSKPKQSTDPVNYAVFQNLLNNADITQSGERVRILVELTPEVLKLGEKSNPR